MLELKNIGLVELNAQEMKEIDGGFWPFILANLALSLIYVLLS
jgi:lactobin A/cerein 7B family class IIb bacteriocin